MPRRYVRKPDPMSVTLSVPVTVSTKDRLWALATKLGKQPTQLARECIERLVVEGEKAA